MLTQDGDSRAGDLGLSSDSASLESRIARLDELVSNGDMARAAEFLDEQMLEIWFGARPEWLMRIMVRLERELGALPPMAEAVRTMMQPGIDPSPDARGSAEWLEEWAPEQDEPTPGAAVLLTAARVFALRMQGRTVEAFELGAVVSAHRQPLEPLFDRYNGWQLFAQVQLGITAMLAGHFSEALSIFTEARMHVVPPALAFLTRDAYVKPALLHACVGDQAVARSLLSLADELPRTSSWAEQSIDATASIARAVVSEARPRRLIAELDAIPMHQVGEMWPFYVLALQQACERDDDRAQVMVRLQSFAASKLPRVEGQGFSGSVIHSSIAANAVVLGNATAAREALAKTDPTVPTTQIVQSMLETLGGHPDRALQIALDMRHATSGLRQLELWRSSLVATGFLAVNDLDGCREALRSALSLPGGLSREETGMFNVDVRRFGAATLPGWPEDPEFELHRADQLITLREVMTPREVEVLQLLAEGCTREQMARRLFLSENTVKTHQRSVYRKLGVSSKGAALIEAERRGLI